MLADTASRNLAYVALTRGRASNHAYLYQRSSGESESLSRSHCLVIRRLEDAVKLAFEAFTPWSVPLVEPLDSVVCFPSGNLET